MAKFLLFFVLAVLALVAADADESNKLKFSFKDGLGEKIKPYLTQLPKMMPLIVGKVKSSECKKQGLAVSDYAKQMKKVASFTDTEEIFSAFCIMEPKCFEEYIDIVVPFLDSDFAKKLLAGVKTDPETLKMFAVGMFETTCKKNDEAEKENETGEEAASKDEL